MKLIHLQVKKPQNCRMKVFTEKQASTNISLIFLNAKMLKRNTATLLLKAVNREEK